MPLARLSARPSVAGAYTPLGAFNLLATFNSPANPTAGIPGAPVFTSWVAIRAIGGTELDKAQQFAQKSTDLIAVPYQDGISESMTLTINDGDTVRTLQIEFIEDDPLRRELRMFCFQVNQNQGSGAVVSPPTPGFYEGQGSPSTLYTDGSIYYDQSTGNLWEQVYGEWVQVGNIPTGGETEMPSLDYHLISAAGTNAAVIKSAAGTLTGWKIYNNANYPIYVKFYDKATAPVPGTDHPKQTIGVNAGESDEVGPGAGVIYTTGIGIAITRGITDLDASAVAADDCAVDVFYQ